MGLTGQLSKLVNLGLALIVVVVVKSFLRRCLKFIRIILPLYLVKTETVIGVNKSVSDKDMY